MCSSDLCYVPPTRNATSVLPALANVPMSDQIPFRCTPCNRLLFTADDGAVVGALTIKCPRCGAINILRPHRAASPARDINQDAPESAGRNDRLIPG